MKPYEIKVEMSEGGTKVTWYGRNGRGQKVMLATTSAEPGRQALREVFRRPPDRVARYANPERLPK